MPNRKLHRQKMLLAAAMGIGIHFRVAGAVFLAGFSLTLRIAFPQGLVAPRYPVISLPKIGLEWLPNEDMEGACGDVKEEEWIRKSAGLFELMVHAAGPSGSGRYWILTVGIAGSKEVKPERGICLQTSTLGWRTLQRFKKLPLPWADDMDNDGKAELIIWDSFPLRSDASRAEFGLMAWIYQVQPDNTFSLDWNLTRRMAGELAEAYRSPLQPDRLEFQKVRNLIARELENFASARNTSSP